MSDPYQNMNPVLASQIKQMIDSAQRQGYTISPGSGYRTVDEQIALRKKNGCPDIWTSPASSCRVPTAIPGKSNHNHGFAMDLVFGSDEAANWAQKNAAKFGLHFPVKGENWHVELINGHDAGADQAVAQAQQQGAIGFDINRMDQKANPQDELASRLDSVMKILGSQTGTIDNPEALMNPNEIDSTSQASIQDQMGSTTTTIPGAKSDIAGQGEGGATGGDAASLQAFAQKQLAKFGWGPDQMPALIKLWNKESGWNPHAQNPTSTAYGIAQFLNGTWEGTGFQKTSDPAQQILAGLTYIKGRYGDPANALNFHLQHNWY